MSKIKEKVYEVLRDELGSGIDINDKVVVLNSSGIDENNQRDLVMRLEEEFNIFIPDKDAETLITVEDVVDYLSKKEKK